MRNSTARIQENNFDTMIALSQRSYGTAWQFQPPMSITLGVKECLKSRKVRIYSATGAWKQTALRIALFSKPAPDYPSTLLGEHPDALITVTADTADHPFSHHPEWRFRGVNEQ
jgi:glucosamine-6-phosphate deaminase